MRAVLRLQVLRRPGAKVLMYFGGNGEAVAASAPEFADSIPDRTLVFVNYRSYGGSSGTPSEGSLVADARAVFDHLAKTYRDIAVLGRSLGSGVAVQLAASRPVSRLVLVTPFDSLVAVARRAVRYFPVEWILKDRYESTRFARSISCPVLVMLGTADEVIRPVHARELAKVFTAGQARSI
ncbi:MAG: hypothetical protein JSR15_07385, partial [Proteobacteria bacterium]|nr:hypothetical protein [Pseudomonadota bacterium]